MNNPGVYALLMQMARGQQMNGGPQPNGGPQEAKMPSGTMPVYAQAPQGGQMTPGVRALTDFMKGGQRPPMNWGYPQPGPETITPYTLPPEAAPPGSYSEMQRPPQPMRPTQPAYGSPPAGGPGQYMMLK